MTNWYHSSDDYFLVGKVKDAHGIRGELHLLVFAKQAEWMDELEAIYLEKENPQTPEDQVQLSIKKLRPHKSGYILSTNDIKDRNQAETYKGYRFYIPKQLLVAPEGERPFLIELKGFQVTDPEAVVLGEVVGFSSNGAQDLLIVKNSVGEFEVPYVDAFIVNVDYEGQSLCLDLPEGLIERPA